MTLLPMRYKRFEDDVLITSEVGDFGFFDDGIIQRLLVDGLSIEDTDDLSAMRVVAPTDKDWRVKSLALQNHRIVSERRRSISYLMLVPTLRCNLSCSYCQVSRAPVNAKGFDWTDEHLELLSNFIAQNTAPHVKLEFQGGEISLRPDMIEKVERIATSHGRTVELVACTNLYEISPEFEFLFDRPNFVISTSLDGNIEAMTINRTNSTTGSQQNLDNIRYVIDKYGLDKISFLPTITEKTRDHFREIIDSYFNIGASGIFLRPVNFMGFARTQHNESSGSFYEWKDFYEKSLEYIKDLNDRRYFEEVYVADLVRKVFGGEIGAFVDFRSPGRFLDDMAVIDFDGTIYPSDEARMLTRTRHVDLSVGSLRDGLDEEKIETLNFDAIHQTNPDCLHCAYMPYCGIDVVDDLSRYNRVDLPKSKTWFCNKQTFLFDWIFEKVRSRDMDWIRIFACWVHRTSIPPTNLDNFLA